MKLKRDDIAVLRFFAGWDIFVACFGLGQIPKQTLMATIEHMTWFAWVLLLQARAAGAAGG